MTDEGQRLAHEAQTLRLIRGSLLAAVLAAVLLPAALQPLLDGVWWSLRIGGVFELSFFETLWTAICYFEIESLVLRIVTDPASPHERLDERPGHKHLWRNGTVRFVSPWRRFGELARFVGPLLLLCAESVAAAETSMR